MLITGRDHQIIGSCWIKTLSFFLGDKPNKKCEASENIIGDSGITGQLLSIMLTL